MTDTKQIEAVAVDDTNTIIINACMLGDADRSMEQTYVTEAQYPRALELTKAGYVFNFDVSPTFSGIAAVYDPKREDNAYVITQTQNESFDYMLSVEDECEGQLDTPVEYIFHKLIADSYAAWDRCGKPLAGTQWVDPASA